MDSCAVVLRGQLRGKLQEEWPIGISPLSVRLIQPTALLTLVAEVVVVPPVMGKVAQSMIPHAILRRIFPVLRAAVLNMD